MSEYQGVGINLNKIANSDDFCSITRMTAMKLLQKPYMTLGDFFKGLSNNDVTALLFMVEMCSTDDSALNDLICLSEMLARAEGAEPLNVDESTLNVNFFSMLITIESLYRQGLIDVFHENMSFGADLGDKPIAIGKDGVRYG